MGEVRDVLFWEKKENVRIFTKIKIPVCMPGAGNQVSYSG
jgi:hypothetical protein